MVTRLYNPIVILSCEEIGPKLLWEWVLPHLWATTFKDYGEGLQILSVALALARQNCSGAYRTVAYIMHEQVQNAASCISRGQWSGLADPLFPDAFHHILRLNERSSL